ncbi:MAG: type VI secretion system secreted protein Hcp [Glaciecola sp.]
MLGHILAYRNYPVARFVYQSNDSNRLHKNPIVRVICLNVLRNIMKFSRSNLTPIKCALTFALFSVTLLANASVQMFLKFDGVDGESQDSTFRNSIEVLSFSEGASNVDNGSGRINSVPSFQNISIVKWLDSSSPALRLRMAQGSTSPTATLFVTTAGSGPEPFVFYEVELTNVYITSFSSSASVGDDRLSEQVTLGYTEIKWTYTKRNNDGSAGGEFSEGWNIEENKKL